MKSRCQDWAMFLRKIPRLGEDKFKLGHTKFEHVWETVDLSGAVREGRGRLVGFEIGTEISRVVRLPLHTNRPGAFYGGGGQVAIEIRSSVFTLEAKTDNFMA
ncbi:hypothetical protein F2P81_015958 [Scophthalmus maximus]|uniref:Uncharacterized protein n=1 Tax=Scophthalmus maximus TaxID=52904 RepID=A0A6A4SAZ9_SCOMX|nr:hypothetical protein F2P81_015958 [Scophthalmus maximus]